MPRKLKTLSGDQIIRFFCMLGFFITRTKGSHIRLCRKIDSGDQLLTIPRHKVVPKGTIKAIYNQAGVFIERQTLDKFFYTR